MRIVGLAGVCCLQSVVVYLAGCTISEYAIASIGRIKHNEGGPFLLQEVHLHSLSLLVRHVLVGPKPYRILLEISDELCKS